MIGTQKARAHMTTDDTNAHVDFLALIQGLSIEPEWKPSVARFFDVARQMARLVEESGALTDAEAAPVFTPRSAE